MAKLPFIQLYKDAWDRDTRVLSLAARGLWDTMLVRMHDENQSGVLTGSIEDLARATHCFPAEFRKYLAELETKRICEVQRSNGSVTVVNRRMKREADAREAARLRQLRKRQGDDADNVTGPSRPESPPVSQPGHASDVDIKRYKENTSYSVGSLGERKTVVEGSGAESSTTDLPGEHQKWLADLAKNPAYRGIDLERSYWKLIAHCRREGHKLTQRYLQNWLKRERPGDEDSSQDNQKPQYSNAEEIALFQANRKKKKENGNG